MTSAPKNPPKIPPNPREVLERNLARARGRIGKTSTMINGRQYAVAVDGTVITFECKRARHRYKIDFGSKRRRLTARLSPASISHSSSSLISANEQETPRASRASILGTALGSNG